MTNHKNTKRALFMSVISMLMCVTMLVGSTFAWFTDNASTMVNKIQSGKLDIELLDGNTENANSLEGKTLTFAKAKDAPADENVLFEPGAKYALQQVWLHNAGDLHAKYQITITGIDGSSKLAEVLDVYVAGTKVNTLAKVVANGGIINSSVIAPGEYYTFGTIELEMQTTAGNEYQGLTMDGIAITVQATQATVEYDSDDNQYDAGAEYDELVVVPGGKTQLGDAVANIPADKPVTISLPALPEGEVYTLPGKDMTGKDITFSGSKDTVVDLTNAVTATNATVTFEGITVKSADSGTYQGIQHAEKVVYKDCTIEGMVFLYSDADFVNCTFNNKNDYCIWTYGNNATFTNCTFNCGGKAILVYHEGAVTATVGVNNCIFNDDNSLDTKKGAVEIGESAYGNKATYNIYINGCTVNGFAVNDEGTSTGSTLWGNKNSMDKDHLNVVIDGVDVY